MPLEFEDTFENVLYYNKNAQDEFPTIYFLHLIESLIMIVGLV